MLPTHRPPTHPGEMLLKEFPELLGVSQAEAATRMSIPFQRLNGIVKGRRAVSADRKSAHYARQHSQRRDGSPGSSKLPLTSFGGQMAMMIGAAHWYSRNF